MDMDRVLRDGPWTFDQHLVLLNTLEKGGRPQDVVLREASFWVQAFDLPCGFMSEKVARDIGNFVGMFIESDPNNFINWVLAYLPSHSGSH